MKHYKSLFLSDIHLGSPKCNSVDLYNFLKSVKFNNLFIIGDLVHGDYKQYPWDAKLVKLLLSYELPVIYINGNHDDFVVSFRNMLINNWYFCEDYIYESLNTKVYLVHGHDFHYVEPYSPEIKYHIGSKVYKRLIRLAALLKIPFGSNIKQRFHKTVQRLFFRGFRSHLTRQAKSKGCQAVMAGHNHCPHLSKRYMNCGDWVGSNTAIAENYDGTWELLKYDGEVQLLQNLRRKDAFRQVDM